MAVETLDACFDAILGAYPFTQLLGCFLREWQQGCLDRLCQVLGRELSVWNRSWSSTSIVNRRAPEPLVTEEWNDDCWHTLSQASSCGARA